MPWHTEKGGGDCADDEWAVIKDQDGSTAGCHATEEDANAQVAALYAEEGDVAPEDTSTANRWHAVATVLDERTTDGRVIEAAGFATRALPLPLFVITTNAHGGMFDEPGRLCGTVESVDVEGNEVHAHGTFDMDAEAGQEAARLVGEQTLRWVSVDLDAAQEDVEMLEEGDCSEEGWLAGDCAMTVVFHKALMAALTIVPIPAFPNCVIVPEGADMPAATQEGRAAAQGLGVGVQAHAMPDGPPAEWFEDPGFDELQRWVTVSDAGRVTGHLAGLSECHIGYADRCVSLDELVENDGFPYFHVGHVVTAEGTQVPTGVLAVKGGHADTSWSWRSAQAHYDDTDSAVADVRLGRDEFGVWFSGVLRPGASAEAVHCLRASGISGDWRNIAGRMRLIGACSVNTPGFPKAKARIVAGATMAVVAAGGRPRSAFEQHGCGCGDSERFAALERRLDRLEGEAGDRILASLDARLHQH